MDEQEKSPTKGILRSYILLQIHLTSCHAAAILLVSLGDRIAEEVDTLKADRTVRGARSPAGRIRWVV